MGYSVSSGVVLVLEATSGDGAKPSHGGAPVHVLERRKDPLRMVGRLLNDVEAHEPERCPNILITPSFPGLVVGDISPDS